MLDGQNNSFIAARHYGYNKDTYSNILFVKRDSAANQKLHLITPSYQKELIVETF